MRAVLVWMFAGALLILGAPSFAQAHKCKGPDGRTVYSDKPCAAGHSGGEIRLRENSIDTSMDWERQERYIQQQTQGGARPNSRTQGQDPPKGGGSNDTASCQAAIRSANMQPQNATPQKIDGDRAAAVRICGYNPWPGPSASEIDAYNRRTQAIEKENRRRLNDVCSRAGGFADCD